MEEIVERSQDDEFVHGWNLPDPEDLPNAKTDKWFIEVCCEENSFLSKEAEQNGWRTFRITQSRPLESVETQILFAAASRHLKAG
eukprot:1282236-Amphidinium_carterae.1